jgi:putative drug exporter of the RND superfamily
MSTESFLASLARRSARRPWRTIAVWSAVVVLAVLLTATLLGGALTGSMDFTNEPESVRAENLIKERLHPEEESTALVVVRSETSTVDDPQFAQRVDDIAAAAAGLGSGVVQGVVTYTKVPDPSLISTDRQATVIPVIFAGTDDEASKHIEELREVVKSSGGPDLRVQVTGAPATSSDFGVAAEEDLMKGELIGVGVALVILALVFGALVAAGIPLLLAGVSVVVALGVAALVGQVLGLSMFITEMVTMIGLATGIDYALFIVSRYREERGNGLEKYDAVAVAGGTAGRAVLFSGGSVILALTGLLIIPMNIYYSMALGAILAVSAAVLSSLTLLPALLGLLGDRVNSLRIPGLKSARIPSAASRDNVAGGWVRLAHAVMRRPVVFLMVSVLVLMGAGAYYLQMETGVTGVASMPEKLESRQAYDTLAAHFPSSLLSPVEVVVDGRAADPGLRASVAELERQVTQDPAFSGAVMNEVAPDKDLLLLTLPQAPGLSAEAAQVSVERLREDYIPSAFAGVDAEVLVAGRVAFDVDNLALLERYTPWVFAFVLGLSFILLTVVFRSLVVPLKAILMNLLSVGAAYGLMVMVFEKGWGSRLFGFQQIDYIDSWIPLFLFTILFGLSMDYHVFLLSRIRERYDAGDSNTDSVAFGVASTARIITGAALIMVAVFGGFALGDLVMFQQFGFGLAAAMLLDATIVRILLVPAAMRLLGDANWWFPRHLRWLPDLRVEPAAVPLPVRERAER